MRISERAHETSKNQAQFAVDLHDLQEKYNLTDIEMLQTLHEFAAGKLKYMLRYERHGDYDRPAMEYFPDSPYEREGA